MTKYVRSIIAPLLIFLVGSSLVTQEAQADGFQLASFSFEQVPSAEINLFGVEGEELNTTSSTSTTKLAIPIMLEGRRRVLLNFITFRILHQTYSNVQAAGIDFLPADLYTLKYGLVFHQELSEIWSLNVLLQPALLSDFNHVSFRDATIRGGFIFEKKVSNKFTYAFGLGYSDDYGKEIVLPVGRIKWKPNEGWRVDLDLPQKIEISHRLSKKVWLGIFGKATGGHYRIGEGTPYRAGSAQQVNRVKYSIVNIGPSISWRTSKSFLFSLNSGTSVYRRFEVFDNDGVELVSASYESSVFVKATLRFLVGD